MIIPSNPIQGLGDVIYWSKPLQLITIIRTLLTLFTGNSDKTKYVWCKNVWHQYNFSGTQAKRSIVTIHVGNFQNFKMKYQKYLPSSPQKKIKRVGNKKVSKNKNKNGPHFWTKQPPPYFCLYKTYHKQQKKQCPKRGWQFDNFFGKNLFYLFLFTTLMRCKKWNIANELIFHLK